MRIESSRGDGIEADAYGIFRDGNVLEAKTGLKQHEQVRSLAMTTAATSAPVSPCSCFTSAEGGACFKL